MRTRCDVAAVLLLAIACQPKDEAPVARSDPSIRVQDCSGPAKSLPDALKANLPARTGQLQPGDKWAELAASSPGGSAGVLYERGRPVIMFTKPEFADSAKAAISPSIPDFPVLDTSARSARWDFAQLADWHAYLESQVWEEPGLVFSDKDESLTRISYGTEDEDSRDRLVSRLKRLGLPCDLLLVDVTGPIRQT